MRVCGLPVEFGEGEGPGVGEERFEVVYRVEDCDKVDEGGCEADGILGENRFGNVVTRAWELFSKMGYTVTLRSVRVCLICGCRHMLTGFQRQKLRLAFLRRRQSHHCSILIGLTILAIQSRCSHGPCLSDSA